MTDHYATSLERGLVARDDFDEASFIDVSHDDFVRDALGTATSIYEHFGRELLPDTKAAMQDRFAASPRHAHGKHEYALDRYGLSEGQVKERFADYVARFYLDWS